MKLPIAAPLGAATVSAPLRSRAAPASTLHPFLWRIGSDLYGYPGKFPIREDYAAALLKEKLGAITPVAEQPALSDEPITATASVAEEAPASVASRIQTASRKKHRP